MASGPITSWLIDGETMETVRLFFWGGGSKITANGDCSHEIRRHLTPWKKSYDQPRQHIKKQRHYFVNKGLSIQSYGFSSSHVWMWKLNYKESWVLKNWCFWSVVLENWTEVVPKYFILSDALVLRIVFLISLSYLSLLVYRTVRDFCVLILYPSV